MLNQTITTAITKHGLNLLKIGAITLTGAIANQVLRGLTNDSISEVIRDVRRAKTEYAERKQQAA